MGTRQLGTLVADLDRRVVAPAAAGASDAVGAPAAAGASDAVGASVTPALDAAGAPVAPAAPTPADAAVDAAVDAAALRLLPIAGLAYRSDAVLPNDLFFCVPGARADGHDFAPDAAARGAVALIVERPVPVELPQLRFDDARLALALISRDFFDDPSASLAVTAVTGTNGKTTTTYLIDWVCRRALAARPAFAAHSVPVVCNTLGDGDALARTGLIGTVETRVGALRLPSKTTTPESLDLQRLLARMRDEGISHVCMEASSHAIALHRVAGVSFAVAAFTNLSQDHLDFHGSMEEYFETKAALFLSPLVARRAIDIDTDYGRRLAQRCEDAGFEVLTCGLAADAQVRAEDVVYDSRRTTLTLVTPEGSLSLTYPLIGGFNVGNVLLAAAAASLLGFGWSEIAEALARAPQIPGRLERVPVGAAAQGVPSGEVSDGVPDEVPDGVPDDDTPDGPPSDASGEVPDGVPDGVLRPPIEVFVDYSHTPDSIAKALDALEGIKVARTLIVFGCGGDRDATKRPLMGAAALAADYAFVTSDNPRTEDPLSIIADILPGMAGGEGRYEVEPDRRRAIARALAAAAPGDLVLIAGKGHEDYQLVGDEVLAFDDRLVAAEELRALLEAGHWREHTAAPATHADAPATSAPAPATPTPAATTPITPTPASVWETPQKAGEPPCG